jgi:hypothetical protein
MWKTPELGNGLGESSEVVWRRTWVRFWGRFASRLSSGTFPLKLSFGPDQ